MKDSIGYDAIAGSYDELYREEQTQKLKLISEFVHLNQEDLLLDVGCGTGLSSSLFNCRKVGLDESLDMLQNAEDTDLMRVCGKAEHLPFLDNAFDCVISLTAVHNFTNQLKAIKEMKRVSKRLVILSILKRSIKYLAILEIAKLILKGAKELDTAKDTVMIFYNKPIEKQ